MNPDVVTLGAVDCHAKSDRTGALPINDNGKLASLVREAARVCFSDRWPISPKVVLAHGASKNRLRAHLHGGTNLHANMARIGTANAEFARSFLQRGGSISGPPAGSSGSAWTSCSSGCAPDPDQGFIPSAGLARP